MSQGHEDLAGFPFPGQMWERIVLLIWLYGISSGVILRLLKELMILTVQGQSKGNSWIPVLVAGSYWTFDTHHLPGAPYSQV